jgi:hypothetical protein
MPLEDQWAAIEGWMRTGAENLGVLVRLLRGTPEPSPAGTQPAPGTDYLSLIANQAEKLSRSIEQFTDKLQGKGASPALLPSSLNDDELLGVIIKSQICMSCNLSAILKIYGLQPVSDPTTAGAGGASEAEFLAKIEQWFDIQIKEMEKVLQSQQMGVGIPPKTGPLPSRKQALLSLERSFAKMDQDLAYAASQHPRHGIEGKPIILSAESLAESTDPRSRLKKTPAKKTGGRGGPKKGGK